MSSAIISSVLQNSNDWWCMTPQTPAYYAYIPYAILLVGIAGLMIVFPRLRNMAIPNSSSQLFSGIPIVSGDGVSETNEPDMSAMDVALKLLNNNERLIVSKLLESDNSMLQKDLSLELNLSPVKIHRAIVGLKDKGIVISEKHYNTNKISIDTAFLHK